jgi:myo-inositol-1-phosphate synthase
LIIMGKVRVAIIGVGNCASSFVQGLFYYRNAKETDRIPGLMHANLGGYHIRDIEISAAIDIDANKVGKDVSEAIGTWPNNTAVFAKVPKMGVTVQRGMTHDGLGKYLSQIIKKAPGSTVDIVKLLKDTGTDVVVNYLPVGSEEATKWYVEQVLEAGCGFVNCIPVFIAREKYWQQRFEKKGLPVIGDDIKSQVGATITHRVLANLFVDRGVRIDRTYQLNFGGNTDFLNMLERERLESKKISKTSAVTSNIPYDLDPENVHVGPSDYVPWLKDRKWCHIRMEGTTFGDVPLNLEMKLEVWDSPNSAGIVIDAVRCAKLGLDHGLKGALVAPSSYFKKSPPIQIPDDLARELVEQYIKDPKGTEKHLRERGAPSVKKDAAPVSRKPAVQVAPSPRVSLNGHANGNGGAAATVKRAAKNKKRRKAAAR